jgi:pilus assembly protein CpaC
MNRTLQISAVLLVLSMVAPVRAVPANLDGTQNQAAPAQNPNAPGELAVTVGKSLIIDSPVNIQRVSVTNGDLVEAVAVNPKEVLINGKAAGETTLILWQQNGNRVLYDLKVRVSPTRLEAVRAEIARELPDQDVQITVENDTAFVRGVVKDIISADRVMSIAGTLGRTVNLLNVEVPPPETQVLLRVRFANVDRGISQDLGINLASGAFNQATSVTTGQYSPLKIDQSGTLSLSDALNIFVFRKDLNLAATIKALESKRLLEMLAEPNVIAINGKQASFVAGGEFPFPMLQGGAGVGAVTIAFREFGVRINFLPVVTPRGTIHLQVAPEVSSLDYANGVTFQGFTIPALATRRVQTEVELDSGQSFVVAGLLDNQFTESLNKIPGLANIPLLGKLFQTRSQSRNNSELLIIITPEVVRPIPAGQGVPSLKYPKPFMESNSSIPMEQPGLKTTGPVPVTPETQTMPVELLQQPKPGQPGGPPNLPPFQLVPVPVPSAGPPATPGLAPAPMVGPTAGGGK